MYVVSELQVLFAHTTRGRLCKLVDVVVVVLDWMCESRYGMDYSVADAGNQNQEPVGKRR